MPTRIVQKAIPSLFSLAILLLPACGGGGGGSSGSTPPPTANSINLTLTDPNTEASIKSIPLGTTARLTATVLGASRRPAANAVVTFAVPDSLVVSPPSGTALTDNSGKVSVLVQPASAQSLGAGTISATAQIGSTQVKGSVNFSVSSPNAMLSGLAVAPNPLSPYGTASVTVNVVGASSNSAVQVLFSSVCAMTGKATITSSVLTVNGQATASYNDKGCGTTDTITASLPNGAVASTTVSVSPPTATTIQFVSATPATIVLKGTGGVNLQETSLVKFKVVDANGNPMSNADVMLDLTTRVGGILLDGTTSAVTRKTNAAGEVQVSVQSGTVPTAVWVTARVGVNGRVFETQSSVLTISTGRPSQDRFSLAIEKHNIEGLEYDGVTTTFTVHASDRLGNPAPDGTAINFIANGGQISPSCTLSNGRCTVTFTSANPRPRGNREPVLGVDAGRVTVLAYAIGEESFVDSDGNNVYDSGESYNDLGNAFVDANENRLLDVGEQQIVFSTSGSSCAQGISTSPYAPSAKNTCDGRWGQAHIRQDFVVVLSGSHANINDVLPVAGYVPNRTYSMAGTCQGTFSFFLFDDNRNPMPAQTKLTIGTLPTDVTATLDGDTVPGSSFVGGTLHSITVKAENTACVGGVLPTAISIPINIETPMKRVTSVPLTFTP